MKLIGKPIHIIPYGFSVSIPTPYGVGYSKRNSGRMTSLVIGSGIQSFTLPATLHKAQQGVGHTQCKGGW